MGGALAEKGNTILRKTIIEQTNNYKDMRKLLFAIIGLLSAINTYAVKAYPFPVEVRQSDGTMLTIVLHGDEDFNYCATTDGALLVEENGNYYIGSIDANGQLKATAQLAHNEALRTPAETLLVKAQNRQLFLKMGEETAQRQKIMREPIKPTGSVPFFPHTGTPKALVILAEFADTTFSLPKPKEAFDAYFNSKVPLEDLGGGETANRASVQRYFQNVSLGSFVPEFDVYGPVKLPSNLKTYGGTKANGDGERMDLLFQDACALLDDEIDFSQYDANDDGYVDLSIIIYAGFSQSMTGNSNECIWPKSNAFSTGPKYDGKKLGRYAVSAELNGFPGCWSSAPFVRINGIGTLCHEFCHTMGLPDFYPTGSEGAKVKGNNQAMEYWSLMDSGNYNYNGYAPVALNAWEREAFGWIEIPTLTESCQLDILPLDDNGKAYRILNDHDATAHEYFLIENIQQIGQNSWQRGHGLLVYHVEYDETAFSMASNKPNNVKGHPRMTIVPADGLLFAQYNVGKEIDGKVIKNADFYAELAGDPYPGTSGVTQLNETMGIVNFQVYKGESLNKALNNITETDGIISLSFINDFKAYTDGIETVALPQQGAEGNFYTLDGRLAGRDLGTLPKGIYVRGGKKIVKQ